MEGAKTMIKQMWEQQETQKRNVLEEWEGRKTYIKARETSTRRTEENDIRTRKMMSGRTRST